MDAWNARFGWVIPSWNTVTELEVTQLSSAGVSNHYTRIEHVADSPEAFDRMAAAAPDAAGLLAHAGVDAICYACTSGSFYRGLEFDAALANRLSEAAGRPVVTMADSLVQAARHLGMQRISVAAPYEDWLMELLVGFLGAAGFEVLKSRGLGHQANILYPPEKAIELADNAWDPDSDGLLMSCGNFRTMETIDEIERRLGSPVVTSIQASVWNLHRIAGHTARHPSGGRLLRPPHPTVVSSHPTQGSPMIASGEAS